MAHTRNEKGKNSLQYHKICAKINNGFESMPVWRNWQTHLTQNQAVSTIRVQVPSPVPFLASECKILCRFVPSLPFNPRNQCYFSSQG